jgi:hypothetical protein
MSDQQSLINGLAGTVASIGAYLFSITIHEVNEWLTMVSLCVGITVGVWTLCRFICARSKP